MKRSSPYAVPWIVPYSTSSTFSFCVSAAISSATRPRFGRTSAISRRPASQSRSRRNNLMPDCIPIPRVRRPYMSDLLTVISATGRGCNHYVTIKSRSANAPQPDPPSNLMIEHRTISTRRSASRALCDGDRVLFWPRSIISQR